MDPERGPDPESCTPHDLIRWSEALAGIARTGLGFSDSLFERERYEEILAVAADMRVAAGSHFEPDTLVHEWLATVDRGVAGYQTPKVAVGAVVGNEAGEILLIKRADSGVWLYPTGWADIGYSPSEVAEKEVQEETGIECRVESLIGVLDGLRLGFTRVPLYSLLFHCTAIGGELSPHPLEASEVGWFAQDDLPEPLAASRETWDLAFSAIRGESPDPHFDAPRSPLWRSDEDSDH